MISEEFKDIEIVIIKVKDGINDVEATVRVIAEQQKEKGLTNNRVSIKYTKNMAR